MSRGSCPRARHAKPQSLTSKRLRVAVLYGGRSGEHEVSLASAAAVLANLNRKRYEPIAIRIEKDGRWVLADRPPSAASAAEVIEQIAARAARLRGGREVLLPPRPGDRHDARARPPTDRDRRRQAGVSAHGSRRGRRLSRPARSVRRGRHDPGPARAGECRLRRLRRAGLRRRHGQARDEDGLPRARAARARLGGRSTRDWQREPGRLSRRESRRSWPIRSSSNPPISAPAWGFPRRANRAELGAAIDAGRRVRSPHRRRMRRAGRARNRMRRARQRRPEVSVAGEIRARRASSTTTKPSTSTAVRASRSRRALDAPMTRTIRRQAIVAFQAIDGAGLARVDFC